MTWSDSSLYRLPVCSFGLAQTSSAFKFCSKNEQKSNVKIFHMRIILCSFSHCMNKEKSRGMMAQPMLQLFLTLLSLSHSSMAGQPSVNYLRYHICLR